MAGLLKSRPFSQLLHGHGGDGRDAPLGPHAALLAADPRDMLQLMRSTRGRVKGEVAFRTAVYDAPTGPWTNTYCFVNSDSGSLRHEVVADDDAGPAAAVDAGFATLLPDLRGCRVYTFVDQASQKPALFLAARDNHAHLHLRPQNQTHFNTWFAALLCWSPLRAGQTPQPTSKKRYPQPLENPFAHVDDEDQRPLLPENDEEENMTLKRDKAILIDNLSARPPSSGPMVDRRQQAVMVILRGNGELSVRAAADASAIATVTLGDIPRSAIHRVSKTAYDIDRVLAIYPHYAKSMHASSRLQPICLSFPSKDLYEAWFIMLRSSAMPELYGSKALIAQDEFSLTDDFTGIDRGSNAPMLRLEQMLQVRVAKARFKESYHKPDGDPAHTGGATSRQYQMPATYYAEILLDEHLQAKTNAKGDVRGSLFWNETHTFEDLPCVLSSVTIRVRKQDLGQSPQSPASATFAKSPTSDRSGSFALAGLQNEDQNCGEACIDMATLDLDDAASKTWPIVDLSGTAVGEITVGITLEKHSILMESEYFELLDILKDFDNTITLLISDHLSSKSARLSELFLNIFQSAGVGEEWLMEMVEEEIYGRAAVDSPQDDADEEPRSPSRSPRPKRDSHALLLFRGTTVLSKAMDVFMRRCGEQYLEETIGAKLREIRDADLDCEVDPSRIEQAGDMVKNWQSLVTATKGLWSAIYRSAKSCPPEMRTVFHHIQGCAQDRYGEAFTSIIYTSVSGFLFLRFFCAAILNPPGFGLVRGSISPRTQRSLMLIAKSLQGLANMTNFANKEPWMAPMDDFTSQHRQQFEEYVDAVCILPVERETTPAKPESPTLPRPSMDSQYSGDSADTIQKIVPKKKLTHRKTFSYSRGPLAAVSQRLHPTAREGYLSVPALIDPARNLSALVDLWLDSVEADQERFAWLKSSAAPADLARFHRLCIRIRDKTRVHLDHLDTAPEKPSMGLVPQKWVVIAERMETVPLDFWRADVDKPPPPEQVKASKKAIKEKKEQEKAPAPANGRPAMKPISEETRRDSHQRSIASPAPTDDGKASLSTRRSSILTTASELDSFPPDIMRDRNQRPGSSSAGSDKSKSKKSDASKRKKSPPRATKEENAMRKLGWM